MPAAVAILTRRYAVPAGRCTILTLHGKIADEQMSLCYVLGRISHISGELTTSCDDAPDTWDLSLS